MSAIAGLLHLDGRPLERALVTRMLDALAHRGGDGSGRWLGDSVALGHQMLWTTPESVHERLPSVDRDSGLVITADARVDNRDELLPLLGLSGRATLAIADSEVILRAYERWGARCVDRLLGDYAFCIWNPRDRELFCARDPLAAKHFYYYHQPGQVFAFASEIKALLTLPFVPRELNELSLAYHLLPVYDDTTGTFYKGISRLQASECLTVRRSGLEFSRSWQPDLTRELRLGSDAEYAEAFRETFEEAVRCRLRSHCSVGSMLSGGLDSSAVTAVAGSLLGKAGAAPLKTFSAVWPEIARTHPKIDERRFMDAVIASGRFDPHFVHLDAVSPLKDWETIYRHEDQPLSAPNMYMDWAIFEAARQNGVRVLLGGTDGDTVVSYGYQDLEVYARRGRWITLVKEARALARHMPRRAHSLKRLVWEVGARPAIPESAMRLWDLLRGRAATSAPESAIPPYARARPLSTDFVRRVQLELRLSDLFGRVFPPRQTARESHWRDISSGNWSYILESFEKAAAAHRVEVRYPFFDRRLIELCIAMPPGQRLKGGYTRSVLRRAMDGILPAQVQWRVDKGSLSAGVCLKLLEYERSTLEDLVGSDDGVLARYLDVAAIRDSYARYAANPLRCEGEAFTLMLAASLGLWLGTENGHDSTRSLAAMGGATSRPAVAVS